MITEDEQKLVETLANVFDDLQDFLIQKNHQHIIYGFLQLKKLSRRAFGSSNPSIDRKFVASVSQKNYSERRKSVSRNSARKSVGKESHASFDIIKGAEFFNQSRKNRPHYQKQYTEVSKYQRPYMDNQNEQPTRFTGPFNNNNNQVLHRSNSPQIVPKLVGLVSSDEISDIERPSGRVRVSHQIKITQRVNDKGLNYERSILEVQDDDDEFEDVVLTRLDKIEQKVNQMLKDKKKQRLQAGSTGYVQPRPPMTPTHHYPPKNRLQNVNSGPNIIYTNTLRGHRNSEFFKYQEPRNNLSSDQMMSNPQMYTFQNTKKNSYAVINKRVSDLNGMRPQFTQRAHKLSQRILSQMPQYVTDNQQYGQSYQIPYRRGDLGVREAQTVIVYQQNLPYQSDIEQQSMLIKNKRLGHYRDSSGTIRYNTQSSQQRPSYSRDQQVMQKQSDYSRMREQAFIDGQNVYKYIPMARYPEKTERHVITRKLDRRGNGQHNGQDIYEQHRVGQVVFIDNLGRQVRKSNRGKQDNYSQHMSQARDDLYHKSSQNSGIRYRPLQGSNIKAYTEQGDFIPSADDFSVSSDGGIYSEIRELREITKQHGIGKGERRESYQNRNTSDRNRLVVQREYQQRLPQQSNEQDYRHQQKTQRNRYLPSRKYSQQTGENYNQEVIIERGPMQQRVYKVVRQVPYVQKQQIRVHNRSRVVQQPVESSQYVQYVPVQQKIVYRTVSHNGSLRSNQPIYINNESQQKYQRIPQSRKTKQSQFRTIIMKNDNRSQKKLSAGSINTFKSIPYRSESRKNTIKQMMEKDKNVEFVQSQSNQQRQQQQYEQEYQQQQV